MPLLLLLFRSDRKSTRLNSSHTIISYAVFCLTKREFRAPTPARCWTCWDSRASPPGRVRRRELAGGGEGRGAVAGGFLRFDSCFFFLSVRPPPEFPPFPLPPPLRL